MTAIGIKEAIARCSERDFDGHTGFKDMTPDERLEWLWEAMCFVHEHKGLAGKRGMREDHRP